MTPDETFVRLQSLPLPEASELYAENYLQYVIDNPAGTTEDAYRFIDPILKPYGWTCESVIAANRCAREAGTC